MDWLNQKLILTSELDGATGGHLPSRFQIGDEVRYWVTNSPVQPYVSSMIARVYGVAFNAKGELAYDLAIELFGTPHSMIAEGVRGFITDIDQSYVEPDGGMIRRVDVEKHLKKEMKITDKGPLTLVSSSPDGLPDDPVRPATDEEKRQHPVLKQVPAGSKLIPVQGELTHFATDEIQTEEDLEEARELVELVEIVRFTLKLRLRTKAPIAIDHPIFGEEPNLKFIKMGYSFLDDSSKEELLRAAKLLDILQNEKSKPDDMDLESEIEVVLVELKEWLLTYYTLLI